MTARLHHISRFYGEHRPQKWVVFLHGILGSGSNWAGFATELARARTSWGFMAIDLRHHGRSEKGSPPDDIAACVTDLLTLFQSENIQVGAVIAHSFGAKIAMRLTGELPGIEYCAIIDADPGPLQSEGRDRSDFPVLRLLDALRDGPKRYDSREEFVQALSAAGFREGIAGWVGKNLKRVESGLILDLDVDRIEAMLEDHHRLDLWDMVETPCCERLDFILGSKSQVVPQPSRDRIASLVTANPRRIGMTVIEDAGHWVHVDAPEALLQMLQAGIPD